MTREGESSAFGTRRRVVSDDSPASQFGRSAQRALLTIAVYLSIGLGPALLIVPFTYIFYPDRGLLGNDLAGLSDLENPA